MKINRLSPLHKGTQPIRVLLHNLTFQFENTNSTFAELSKTFIRTNRLHPEINYHINTKAIYEKVNRRFQLPFVECSGKITIHETFLSYIGAFAIQY